MATRAQTNAPSAPFDRAQGWTRVGEVAFQFDGGRAPLVLHGYGVSTPPVLNPALSKVEGVGKGPGQIDLTFRTIVL